MPKASVDKYCESLSPENKIRTSGQRLVSAPTDNTVGTENFGELELCVFVAAGADRRLHCGAFLLVEHISHLRMFVRMQWDFNKWLGFYQSSFGDASHSVRRVKLHQMPVALRHELLFPHRYADE
jgi:hypothetical protein